MRLLFKLGRFAGLLAALILTGARADAQGYFGLSVTSSADSLLVSNNLTYTITVTNLVGVLSDALVSNTLPASAQFVTATPSLGGTVTNYANVTVFHLGGLVVGAVAQMNLTVQPTAAGFLTNQVFVAAAASFVTNTAATNVVTQITNTVPAQADLAVAIAVPATAVITNDLMTYSVSVTNLGPNAAPNVMLTNTLPAGVILKGNYTVVSSNVILNLGTMPSGGFASFPFTLQPTNAGALNFFAAVGAAGVLDPNPANNTASNSLTVIGYLPGELVAVTNSAQVFNPQNGLVEQSINLSNIGTNAVPAVRIVVTGLLTNRLFNASGTNNGSPFVVYATTLETNRSVNLLLQFFALNYFSFGNSQLQAFAVPAPDLTPPAGLAGANLRITRIVKLSNGSLLIEFPSLTNRTYTVVYSDNVLFSNAMIAPPAITASANQKQWVDYGPPTTVSAPTNSAARFYRVFLNP